MRKSHIHHGEDVVVSSGSGSGRTEDEEEIKEIEESEEIEDSEEDTKNASTVQTCEQPS